MKVEMTLKGRKMTTRNIERLCFMTKQEVVDLKREIVGDVTEKQGDKLIEIKLATLVESTRAEETISTDTVPKERTSNKGKRK